MALSWSLQHTALGNLKLSGLTIVTYYVTLRQCHNTIVTQGVFTLAHTLKGNIHNMVM